MLGSRLMYLNEINEEWRNCHFLYIDEKTGKVLDKSYVKPIPQIKGKLRKGEMALIPNLQTITSAVIYDGELIEVKRRVEIVDEEE